MMRWTTTWLLVLLSLSLRFPTKVRQVESNDTNVFCQAEQCPPVETDTDGSVFGSGCDLPSIQLAGRSQP